MFVESVMSHPVLTVQARQRASEAAELMREHRIRHLPVLDDGQLVGMMSHHEIGDGGELIADVMHRDAIVVASDTPVENAAALMLEHKIGSLVVLDQDGRLVGIVTESDLFRLLTQMLGGQEPSTRLELRVRDLSQDLTLVAALACNLGIAITSLFTEPSTARVGEPRVVVLRVGTIDAARFVRALRDVGLAVDAPRARTRAEGTSAV